MTSQELQKLVREAEWIYQHRLKQQLEQSHPDAFVAIEPVSGDYFLGPTLSEALGAARTAHPDRLAHAVRVGHKAAVHLGLVGQQ
jgi:hypothetical protein